MAMDRKNNLPKKTLIAFVPLVLLSVTVNATQTLSSTPLFLQSGVQPNLMFGVDDSGSMDFEIIIPSKVKNRFTGLPDQISAIDPRKAYYQDWRGRLQVNGTVMVFSCAGTNPMFYDSNKTYTPWKGFDETGEEFANQPINYARKNPYYKRDFDPDPVDFRSDSGSGGYNYIDLTTRYNSHSYGYFQWHDLNGNGEWDDWNDLNNDGVADPEELECPTTALSFEELDAWYVDTSEMSAEEQTNYANWYSYYRKREYVAKRALTQIVSDSVARVGLKSMHNNNGILTNVTDVDDITQPTDSSAETNKKALLKQIARIYSFGGTPLRRMANDIGRYFDGSNSPILSSDDGGKCQQNFSILMSDGDWNKSFSGIGNVDGSNTPSEWAGGYYADKYSDTLADIAMKYYETDLEPTMPDEVPIQDEIDENPAQHLVTYTVAFGLSGQLDESMGFYSEGNEKDPSEIDGFAWPDPYNNVTNSKGSSRVDDMRHAAYNGRGLFLSANNPDDLISRLNESIQDVQDRTTTASTVAVTSGSFNGLSMAFRSQFDSADWQGRIEGIPLEWDTNTQTFIYNDAPSKVKNASVVPKHSDRNIVTYNGSQGIPFQYSRLSDAQKAIVKTEALVDFIRGDNTYEADKSGNYRERPIASGSESYLGDLVNSSPLYIADPKFRYPDNLEAKSYKDYRLNPDGDGKTTMLSIAGQSYTLRRTPMIYVGSNDGMLHGFKVDPDPDATDFGQEVFAYVPSMIMNRFEQLASKKYYHTYTVDGSPVSGDVYFDNAWRTVLVGGLNAGGQGIYALDVSKPQEFTSEEEAAKNVLWEFSDSNDADLGFTFSKPIIARTNNNKWVAIFGNGYNSTYGDGNVGTGSAVLYVVDIQTGSLIRKIDTGVNDITGKSNGLSSPNAIDIDGDYNIDYVYAGDLEGNLWKFDLTNDTPANWKVAYQTTSDNPKNIPLFTACSENSCDADNRQPITAQPLVKFNTDTSNGLLIYFGTGSYVYNEDAVDKALQSFYAIWDRNESNLSQFKREHLLRQEILAEQNLSYTDSEGNNYSQGNWQRVTSNHTMKWWTGQQLPTDSKYSLGWYMDLIIDSDNDGEEEATYTYKGERVVINARYSAGENEYIEFYTLTPDTDPCSSGSDGWVMRLDPNSGARKVKGSEVVDADKDGDIDSEDTLTHNDTTLTSSGFKVDGLIGLTGFATVVADKTEQCLDANDAWLCAQDTNLGRWNWKELE